MSDFFDFDIYTGGGNRNRPIISSESSTPARLHIHKVPMYNVSKVAKRNLMFSKI